MPVTVTSGNGQDATIGSAFANPLVATVTANDPLEPVTGGVVHFTAPGSGASATLSTGSVTRDNTPTFTGTAVTSPSFVSNPTPQTGGALVQLYVQLVEPAGQPAAPVKAVVQRVSRAAVRVDGRTVG